MRGNAAIMKCLIPSFVADFVSVEAWIDEEGNEFSLNKSGDGSEGGKFHRKNFPFLPKNSLKI